VSSGAALVEVQRLGRAPVVERHYIYLLSGPSGVYVGLTVEPERRERSHRASGSHLPTKSSLPVHVAMFRDGAEQYRFEVIGECAGLFDARAAETAAVMLLRRAGKRVFNRFPCRRVWCRLCADRHVVGAECPARVSQSTSAGA
jgi:hypothetical protein